jgi:hypothetical protein
MSYASSVQSNLESLAKICIFPLIVYEALLISTSETKFPKLQTHLRSQRDSALYLLPRLISLH